MALALAVAASLAVVVAGLVHAVALTFVVNSTADAPDANPGDGICQTATVGQCTLRAAIQEANENPAFPERNTIDFLIPATDPNCAAPPSGVCTISPSSELPAIGESMDIDGYTQPGASPNTLTTGSNAELKIELSGANAGGNAAGITVAYADGSVKGLVINRFGGSGILFVDLNGETTSFKVEGNYVGTDASGTQALGNRSGVEIFGDSQNVVVGGTSPQARNVISGNTGYGVYILSPGDPNASPRNNRVEGNYIGADASGTGDLGNGYDGVLIQEASDNTVGGTSAGAANVISGNGDNGVVVAARGGGWTGNRILRNSISGNELLGIDLYSDDISPNDPGDADTGPNNLQNYPVIVSATTTGATTTIQGTLNSTPNDTFNLQFFSSPQADPSGFGEGETFEGQTVVTTNGSGNAAFLFTTPRPVPAGRVITATATNTVTGDTSEFSEAVGVDSDDPPPPRPQCSDGVDNDGDGQTDSPDDPECQSPTDDSEGPDAPAGCTIVGTNGDDELSGTAADDTICGLGGDDTINAGSGNDTVKGGDGDDIINGDSGTDTLEGEADGDNARGGAGGDSLSGGEGPDRLRGESGNDAINARDGVRGNDQAHGGTGRDACSRDRKDETATCER